MPSSLNTLGTTTGYYELGPASRHRNAIQVDSPLAAHVQQDQNRRLAGLLHYGPQFPSKLVLIGNDVPGCVAWRQDSDSGSGGYGLCHGLVRVAAPRRITTQCLRSRSQFRRWFRRRAFPIRPDPFRPPANRPHRRNRLPPRSTHPCGYVNHIERYFVNRHWLEVDRFKPESPAILA